MRKFEIIGDASFDLSSELRERFGIYHNYVKSDVVFPDGTILEADNDWTNLDPKKYFESMRSKKNVYKSAVRGVEEFIKTMEEPLKAGSDILCVALSSNMSASYRLYLNAKEELSKKYPERKIFIVDSLRYSTAEAMFTVYAAKCRDELGMSIEETAKWLEDNKHRFHQMGPLDDLFFLHKSGRISFGKAFFGTLAGIMPMGDFNREGRTTILGKAKGHKKALEATIAYIKETIENPEDQIIFIAHSNREDKAMKLKEMILKEIKCKEVIVTWVGEVCGANIGPGLCAAYYVGKEISEGDVEEEKLMKSILARI